MQLDDKNIKQILLDGSYITEGDLKKGEEFSKTHRTGLVEYLLSEGLITKDILGQAMAESWKVAYSDLNSNLPAREQVLKIPEATAKKLHVVLFSETKSEVVITTDNPMAKGLEAELKTVFPDKKIIITFSLPEDINANFAHYEKALETRFSKIIEGKTKIAPELLETIFTDALSLNVKP